MTPSEHLAVAKETIRQERDAVAHLLSKAEACAVRAYVHFDLGQHEQAKAELEKGCDLEYEALAECEALGGLSEALYPEAEL